MFIDRRDRREEIETWQRKNLPVRHASNAIERVQVM